MNAVIFGFKRAVVGVDPPGKTAPRIYPAAGCGDLISTIMPPSAAGKQVNLGRCVRHLKRRNSMGSRGQWVSAGLSVLTARDKQFHRLLRSTYTTSVEKGLQVD